MTGNKVAEEVLLNQVIEPVSEQPQECISNITDGVQNLRDIIVTTNKSFGLVEKRVCVKDGNVGFILTNENCMEPYSYCDLKMVYTTFISAADSAHCVSICFSKLCMSMKHFFECIVTRTSCSFVIL